MVTCSFWATDFRKPGKWIKMEYERGVLGQGAFTVRSVLVSSSWFLETPSLWVINEWPNVFTAEVIFRQVDFNSISLNSITALLLLHVERYLPETSLSSSSFQISYIDALCKKPSKTSKKQPTPKTLGYLSSVVLMSEIKPLKQDDESLCRWWF